MTFKNQTAFFQIFRRWQMLLMGFGLTMLSIACNKPERLGVDFFPDQSFNIEVLDTLSLSVTSVLHDSLVTSSKGRLLVGSHQDDYLGKITSLAYFQLGLSSTTAFSVDAKNLTYDSITLVLKYDGYSYYDTSQLQRLYVHQVFDDIEIPELDSGLYNKTQLAYSGRSLGATSFYPKPNENGMIEIKLQDQLGQALFNLAAEDAEEASDDAKFKEYFKGLVLVPDISQSAAILGFSPDSLEMRLYVTDRSALPVNSKHFSFPASGGVYYNQIMSDRDGTAFSKLTLAAPQLNSNNADNQAFIQAGEGVSLRVEIPYLSDLLAAGEQFIISKAVLDFYPISGEKESNMPLPSRLNMNWVDENNEIFHYGSLSAILNVDDELNRDTHYEVDITDFVKYQIQLKELNKNALLFEIPSTFQSSVNRIIIGNAKYSKRTLLKIYRVSI